MDIKLEPLEQKDADQVFLFTSNPEVAEYMRFNTHKTKAEAMELIQSYTEHGSLGFRITKACREEVGEIIGIAAMKQEEGEHGAYSVSIFTAPEYWNKGCSTKALDMLKQIASERKIPALSAYIVEKNISSRRVAEKCGFRLKNILHFDDMDSGLYVYECIIEAKGGV